MKKIFTTIAVLVAGFMSAQDFIVTNGNNGEITNGEVLTFNDLGAAANIHVQIHNQSNQDLFFKLKAVSRNNTDGSMVNFCFGTVCLNNFVPGQYVPPTVYENVLIGPGETNDPSDKFFNFNPGDGQNYPMTFEFALYQYTSAEQDQTTGTEVLRFSYEYAPTAGTPEMTLQKMGIQVANTLVDQNFTFTAAAEVEMNVYDLNGRKVSSKEFLSGDNNYDASMLEDGTYLVRFTNKEGHTATVKIVKQ